MTTQAVTARATANPLDAPDQEAFAAFAAGLHPQSPLRAAITAAYRRSEAECLKPLLDLATLSEPQAIRAADTARSLVTRLRGKVRAGGVEGLIHEYTLSS